jgi:hypothetical protein
MIRLFPWYRIRLENSIQQLKEIKCGDILVWRNNKFNIELMDKTFYYYDLLKDDKNKQKYKLMNWK